MLRLRAEALAERREAPAGLGRRVLGARASPPACAPEARAPGADAADMRAGGARTHELEWGAGVLPACGDCGLKPSLSAWKPRRGYGVESWVRGRLARLRRLRAEALAERREAPAGLWRRVLGARASRPHARRRRAHLEQMLLICAPEARAPINLNGARASRPHAEIAG